MKTLNAILLNFRAAMLALIPMVERVGIAWRRADAYDEWDAIVSTLFKNLVLEVVRWSLQEDEQEGFELPSYDLLLPSYARLCTLEVVHPSLQPGRWLFHAFGTDKEPLDVIEVLPLSDDGEPLSEALEWCAIDGSAFRLRIVGRASLIEEVDCDDCSHGV